MDEKKALSRNNGCKCGKAPRTLKCPLCGSTLGRVDQPPSQETDGSKIKSHKLE